MSDLLVLTAEELHLWDRAYLATMGRRIPSSETPRWELCDAFIRARRKRLPPTTDPYREVPR